MQHSTSQYDDLARVPRARTRQGSRRGTTASRHRRHSPARCSCRVVSPIHDARLADLILADHRRFFTCNSGLGARNGFGEPRDREAKSTLSRPRPAAETARPAFETRENARKVRTIRQRPQNIGSHRTAWWAREDSKLQPDHYEWSAGS